MDSYNKNFERLGITLAVLYVGVIILAGIVDKNRQENV